MPRWDLRPGLRRHEQRLRFLAAGGFNTLVGLSFFPALLWLSPWLYRNYIVGLVISQVCCTVIAFAMYKLLVFRHASGSLLREFLAFVSFYLINYVANIAALPALVQGLHLSPIVAQFGFSIVLIVGSYFWHSRVTFRTGTKVP